MTQINALVLRAAGINCDVETQHALQLAGAEAQRIHVNRIIGNPDLLDGFQILVIPGGFSYGDDVAAGKILANQIIHHLADRLREFIESGKIVLGICNGFQVLVKTGILGKIEPAGKQQITITYNDSGKFEDRWVYLEPSSEKCIFIEQGRRIYLPIAHGEGKVVFENEGVFEKVKADDRIVFRYVDEDGNFGPFPVNPNGSTDSIAGLCDSTGRVMGLMPHPERFVRFTQHPHWTRLGDKSRADGRTIFDNAVKYVKQNFL
ncbi:MAG: phosphoribosylformylglycinamidine synthase I [Planctomycetes bacterium]|nr:phosphoribosylformylglycinamidine synthase I [Planctomycetota bacterium]MBU1518046.1 phosphoribosylformylglycinamidine synthase I [Planctomycetota bacterium]MBU2457644.1 phosphoribosylformylglycinamidine synthase I [Planctomycetota bacterium]MBU2597380.1 phosphoribosylformylglycinamidine synthase I [Planctomycetota bacterium]